jgi:hypothetical protein
VLFESVINSRWFLRTSVILFLNKIDVFKQKLPKVPLVHYFPEYTGEWDAPVPPRCCGSRIPLADPGRRRGYQQGGEIHPVAIHPDQPRTTEYLPTPYTGNGHVKRTSHRAAVAWARQRVEEVLPLTLDVDPTRVRRCEGNDLAKRSARLGHSMRRSREFRHGSYDPTYPSSHQTPVIPAHSIPRSFPSPSAQPGIEFVPAMTMSNPDIPLLTTFPASKSNRTQPDPTISRVSPHRLVDHSDYTSLAQSSPQVRRSMPHNHLL